MQVYDYSQDREPPSAKRVSDLLDTEFPSIASYIEPEVLPKGSTFIFGGEAKIGKSFMMGEFARALVLAKSPFDYKDFYVPQKARVLVVEQELGPRGFKKRLAKVFEREPRREWEDYLYYESKRPELQLDRPDGRRYFVDMIKDVKPQVLILDPISMMHGYDENDSSLIAKLFRTLELFKKVNPQEEMSVILSHHFGKPPRDLDGFDRLSEYNFRGSSKWKDTPDTICTMYRAEDLNTPWESWRNHVRWITRHESSPPEMVLTVNQQNDDGRVRWERNKGGGVRLLEEGPPKKVEVPKKMVVDNQQVKFSFDPL